MGQLENLAGVSEYDPEYKRALAMAQGDRELLQTLVRMRRRSGLTQEEVATRLGISQPSVAAFERHDNDPKLSTLRRYAQVVGLVITHHVSRDASNSSFDQLMQSIEHLERTEDRFRSFETEDEQTDRQFAVKQRT